VATSKSCPCRPPAEACGRRGSPPAALPSRSPCEPSGTPGWKPAALSGRPSAHGVQMHPAT
jgi:hypothetical protein